MNIVYTTDDNFIDVLYASISSLYDTNGDLNLNIWIIADKVSDKSKNKINKLAEKYCQNEVNWIENLNIPYKLKLDRGSMSAFSRLFLGSRIPSELKKILYVDCDIIFMNSLEKLFNFDFEGNIVQGVSDVLNKEYKKILGIPADRPVFNTGVLYIDLEKWREENIEQQLFSVIKKFNGNVIQGDEGILNAVLFDSYKEINPKYNYMTIFEDMNYKDMLILKNPVNYYSEQVLKEARDNIVIRHYTTCFLSKRPWQQGSEVAHLDEFKKYYKGDYKKVRESKMLKIYKKLPNKIAVNLVGFIQGKIRPKVYKIFK